MAENSPVKEKECDLRRKDLYDKYNELKEVVDQMKGGLKVLCYGVPIVLGIFGFFGKMELNRIHEAIKSRESKCVETIRPVSVQWNEDTKQFDAVENECENSIEEIP